MVEEIQMAAEDDWDQGDENAGWGEVDDDEDGGACNTFGAEFMGSSDPGFKIVQSREVNKQVLARIEELNDVYTLNADHMIIIARFYSWNVDKMQDWFNEATQERLKYQLGLEFNPLIPQSQP